MYNLRYHIASLVAVFLALAIGLILGGLVVRQGGFDRQQRVLVSSLQTEYAKLKKANTGLKADLALESGLSAQVTNAWSAGRMNGQTVAVYTSGDKDEGLADVQSAVAGGGGTVVTITAAHPGFGLSDSKVATAVASVLGTAAGAPTSAQVAKSLVAEWSQAKDSRPLTDALIKAGELKISGLSGSTIATQLVDIAAFKNTVDPAGIDLAQAYAGAGLYAVGAEKVGADNGLAASAAARQVSALDTLGTIAGRFTLVALFTGGQQGYYSTTAKGTSPFPPMPTQ
jgi:hypothetical protein